MSQELPPQRYPIYRASAILCRNCDKEPVSAPLMKRKPNPNAEAPVSQASPCQPSVSTPKRRPDFHRPTRPSPERDNHIARHTRGGVNG